MAQELIRILNWNEIDPRIQGNQLRCKGIVQDVTDVQCDDQSKTDINPWFANPIQIAGLCLTN